MMSRHGNNSAAALQEEIRKQLGSSSTTRFVRSLPAFQVDHAMPERLTSLLAELARAEAAQRNSGLNGACR